MTQLPKAEKRLVTEDIRPDVQHENGLIRYLPRWFNHMEAQVQRVGLRDGRGVAGDHLATPDAVPHRATAVLR